MVSRSGRAKAEHRREQRVDRLIRAIFSRSGNFDFKPARAHLSRAERERASQERKKRYGHGEIA